MHLFERICYIVKPDHSARNDLPRGKKNRSIAKLHIDCRLANFFVRSFCSPSSVLHGDETPVARSVPRRCRHAVASAVVDRYIIHRDAVSTFQKTQLGFTATRLHTGAIWLRGTIDDNGTGPATAITRQKSAQPTISQRLTNSARTSPNISEIFLKKIQPLAIATQETYFAQ